MSNAFIQALLMDDPDAGGGSIVIGPDEPAPNPDTGGTCLTDPYYFVAQEDTALDTGYYWGSVVTFSNSNRTVDFTSLSGGSGVATYVAHSTGKYYFEIVRNSGDLYGTAVRDDYGCARAPRSFYGQYVADGIAYRRGGAIVINGTTISGATALSNGDVVGYAVDFDAHKVWISLNGSWLTGNPSAGTSPLTSSLGIGYYHIGISGEGGSAANMTINARDSDLVYPKPTGFISWTTAAISAGPITSLSIHANSTFKDYSAAEKETVVYSPLSLDTSVKKFDSASGNFTLTNSGLWISPTPVGFGSSALTIEAQIYPTLIAGDTRCIVSVAEPNVANLANMYVGVLTDGSLVAFLRTATGGSTVQISSSAGAVALNTWQHVELGIDGTNAYLFLAGALVASTSSWATYPSAKANYVAVGRKSSQFSGVAAFQFRGNIDEVHVTKNLCKHTTTFTPPAYAYCEFSSVTLGPPIPGTEALTGIGMTATAGDLNSPAGFRRLSGQAMTTATGSTAVYNPNVTRALTGQNMTLYRGAITALPYPNLLSATIELNPIPTWGALEVSFLNDGTYLIEQVTYAYSGKVTYTGRWLEDTAIDETTIAHQYRCAALANLGDGTPTLNTSVPGAVGQVSVVFVVPPTFVQYVEFSISLVPRIGNPRYGEIGYTGTFRISIPMYYTLPP